MNVHGVSCWHRDRPRCTTWLRWRAGWVGEGRRTSGRGRPPRPVAARPPGRPAPALGWLALGWLALGWPALGWLALGWLALGWPALEPAVAGRPGPGTRAAAGPLTPG